MFAQSPGVECLRARGVVRFLTKCWGASVRSTSCAPWICAQSLVHVGGLISTPPLFPQPPKRSPAPHRGRKHELSSTTASPGRLGAGKTEHRLNPNSLRRKTRQGEGYHMRGCFGEVEALLRPAAAPAAPQWAPVSWDGAPRWGSASQRSA